MKWSLLMKERLRNARIQDAYFNHRSESLFILNWLFIVVCKNSRVQNYAVVTSKIQRFAHTGAVRQLTLSSCPTVSLLLYTFMLYNEQLP